jgi:cytochrome c nitrite reductase small subunit
MPSVSSAASLVALVAAAAVGVAFGIAGFTFVYAKGASYLTNDPAACANCHVMQAHYDAWTRSSHRTVAVCNDCHAPHDFFGKYTTKAINGWNHSRAFTLDDFHEPMAITARNRSITEGACRSCHADLTRQIESHGTEIACLRCHAEVGHME